MVFLVFSELNEADSSLAQAGKHWMTWVTQNDRGGSFKEAWTWLAGKLLI